MKTQKHWVLVVVCLLIAGIRSRAQEASPEPIIIGETLRIASKKLGETREIRVYPPVSDAGSKRRYPVIYTLDGEVSGPTVASAVRAQYTGYPPGGDPFQLEVAFVRVVDGQSLQWGIRNGRGPGVMVHSAKLVDENTLEGTTEGIGFIHGPPPGNFTCKRTVNDKKTSGNIIDEAASLIKVGFAAPQRPLPWDKVKEVAIGSAAPDWRLKTADGETVTLSELRGKVVVLDFWANWRGPCRKLEPLFDQLAHEYQGKPVKFFTMSIWPDQDFNPQVYLNERKKASTFLIGEDAVAKDYGIWGIPTYYVIDPAGKISYTHVLLSVNSESLERRLREAIEQALSKE